MVGFKKKMGFVGKSFPEKLVLQMEFIQRIINCGNKTLKSSSRLSTPAEFRLPSLLAV